AAWLLGHWPRGEDNWLELRACKLDLVLPCHRAWSSCVTRRSSTGKRLPRRTALSAAQWLTHLARRRAQ
ncbi:hypothetical protein HaLaN_10157, partial [Haematococcus lacustris]